LILTSNDVYVGTSGIKMEDHYSVIWWWNIQLKTVHNKMFKETDIILSRRL